jgi:hypothetical protein
MNEQPTNAQSASPLGERDRFEVRGLRECANSDDPHPTLSLEKGEATDYAMGLRNPREFDYS